MDVYKEWLGIPEESRPPSYYELLRLVQFEDDSEKIRKHYKKLNGHVRKYATGQYSVQSQELLNELAKAMLCLTDADRKREYDESLGREFDDAEEGLNRKPLGRVLVEGGHITRDQLQEAESFAEARGLSMRDAVVQMELVGPEIAAEALARELGYSFVDLRDMLPEDAALDTMPRDVVKRNTILPLFEDEGVVLVACIDQPDPELEDEVRLRFGLPMRGVIAAPRQVRQAIAKYYAPGARSDSAEAEVTKKSGGKSGGSKPKQKRGPLTDDELAERKPIGLLIMMSGVIVGGMLDVFLPPTIKPFSLFGYFFLLLCAPLTIGYVLLFYWKK